MSLLGMIGLNFGKSRSSSKQTGTITDELDSLISTQESSTGSRLSDSASTTSSTAQSRGEATGQTESQTTGDTRTQQRETATGTSFGQDVLNLLKGALGGSTGGFDRGSQGIAASLEASMNGLNFDPQDYARGITDAAATRINDARDASINQMFSMTGGSSSGNTMAALLESDLRGRAEGQIASVQAEALARGSEIANQNINTTLAAGLQSINPLMQLAQLLKGGETTQTGSTEGAQSTAQSQAGKTAQQTAESATQLQTQLAQVLEALSQLTSGTQNRDETNKRTLDVSSSGSGTQFGASLGR